MSSYFYRGDEFCPLCPLGLVVKHQWRCAVVAFRGFSHYNYIKNHYEIYKTDDQYLFIDIKDGELALHAEYFSDHYNCDTHYFLNPDSARRLLVQLRLKHGIRNKLSTIFKNEFGTSDGAIKFKEYCDEIGVEAHVTAIS